MNIRLVLSIFISKITIKACRLFKLGGTTLPGKIARKIYPGVLKVVTNNFKIIMVTGTNGKTTTTRIIGQILKENNIDFITNKSGANLVSGITTTFIDAVNYKGVCNVKIALIEVDEAAFKVISNYVDPNILVVTNFFRDQLDRYGELYSTLKGVHSGILKSDNCSLILNADDSLCASLGNDTTKRILYYGINNNAYNNSEDIANNDAMFCLYCKTKYEYSAHVYGHLGDFSCPTCGYSRPDTHITCTKVKDLTSSFSQIEFGVSNTDSTLNTNSLSDAKINLPGLYNIYNALAAISCGEILELPIEKTISALGNFECGFGRMETIISEGRNIKVILVKNPTGFNQVINFLLTETGNIQLAFIINDKLADGTDISWLWDVDFEKLQQLQEKTGNIYTSGIRAEDMAVRLKYAGIYTNKISIIKDYHELIETGLTRTGERENFYILPTYTAMLDIRKILKKKFNLKDFWK